MLFRRHALSPPDQGTLRVAVHGDPFFFAHVAERPTVALAPLCA